MLDAWIYTGTPSKDTLHKETDPVQSGKFSCGSAVTTLLGVRAQRCDLREVN